ncbi:hypothetical protein FP2506_16654 [Fulvimarina pelagi HTCC2506]|uniref:Uncharacterized protein n=1 Tax=Fulvimarina pelagi HTCC2506 TaxID=314231 RepID=Q0G2U9_9HYPH|nr:hypothetical protein [Fulvimarina pelagi]EAU42082.1 hypothetical protein FP2506_16654 [Fulvimarina pelagi HTCC2506]
MNTSPITKWEVAEAYFTFANSSFGISVCFAASVAIVAFSIWYGTWHETKDFAKHVDMT